MLEYLHVKNLVLIDEIEIRFGEHLNILTGETGAGKSILIGSIEGALGKKISKDMIRNGSEEALIEMIFFTRQPQVIKQLESQDIPINDGEILIKRVITDKRSINKINDQTVTLQTLKSIASLLLNLHGQQEHQTLLMEKNHRMILDHFLSENGHRTKEKVKEAYDCYREKSKAFLNMTMDERERQREIALLEHETSEIEDGALEPGEDQQLEDLYQKMIHGKEISESCRKIYMLTGSESESSMGNQMGLALKEMGRVSQLDPQAEEYYSRLLGLEDMVREFHHDIEDYSRQMEFDEASFSKTGKRLNVINDLKSRYGDTIDDILSYGQRASERLSELQNFEENKQSLELEVSKSRSEFLTLSENLSKERKKTARELEKRMTEALKDLNFLSVVFQIVFTPMEEPDANGADRISFFISTNPGQEPRPLSEVASGGELSRIMLAVKSVIAHADPAQTLVFDEIDTGISGETAIKVAKRMSVIAKENQVIAITHLPQIAAWADDHFFIEKNAGKGQTTSMIRCLSTEESILELSRMISGNEAGETSLKNAKEMKSLADHAKIY